jgi:1-acyl-sn-glycerol-3-phosphate acyltransferase
MSESVSESNEGAATSVLAMAVATIVGNLYLFFGGLLFGALAILAAWIPPRGEYSFPFARAWARGVLWSSGVSLDVTGNPESVAGEPVVFMANHQSLYDIPVMLVSVPGRICFLAKRSLFYLPIFGWALAAVGFIPIDRNDRSRAREAFARSLASISEGVSIVIYPEETRSIDGRMLPFRRGGFLMALKGHAPIVPVGIRGTLSVRAKGGLVIRPGRVEVHYGEAVAVDSFGVRRKQELVDEVEARVAALAAAPRAGDVG